MHASFRGYQYWFEVTINGESLHSSRIVEMLEAYRNATSVQTYLDPTPYDGHVTNCASNRFRNYTGVTIITQARTQDEQVREQTRTKVPSSLQTLNLILETGVHRIPRAPERTFVQKNIRILTAIFAKISHGRRRRRDFHKSFLTKTVDVRTN